MTDLAQNTATAFSAVGTDVGALQAQVIALQNLVATNAGLSNADKLALQASITTLQGQIAAVPGQIAGIISATPSDTHTLSSNDIVALVNSVATAKANAAVAALSDGDVATAKSAIQALSTALASEGNLVAAMQAIDAKAVRVDVDQTGVFTAVEKAQARANISAAAASDVAALSAAVGNAGTNMLAAYTNARDAARG